MGIIWGRSSLQGLEVIDHSGARLGEYEDVSKVEKYKISQEAYDQRQGMGYMVMKGVWGDQREYVQVAEVVRARKDRQGH